MKKGGKAMNQQGSVPESDDQGVRIPPPLVYVTALLIGVVIYHFVPVIVLPDNPAPADRTAAKILKKKIVAIPLKYILFIMSNCLSLKKQDGIDITFSQKLAYYSLKTNIAIKVIKINCFFLVFTSLALGAMRKRLIQ